MFSIPPAGLNMVLIVPFVKQVMTSEWYQNFPKKLNNDDLFELIAAANYMTIKPLLDLACLWVTFQMQGKTVQDVSWCFSSTGPGHFNWFFVLLISPYLLIIDPRYAQCS